MCSISVFIKTGYGQNTNYDREMRLGYFARVSRSNTGSGLFKVCLKMTDFH